MFADVLQVSPHTIIQRTRQLPMEGRVLVVLGDAVQPDDVIAEAILPAGVITLDLCRGLGLLPEAADACVVRKPGDALKEGDLIAQYEGKLTRLVQAPADGRLVELRHGKAILSTGSVDIQARAGMIGVVADVLPASGALLRTEGSLIQGIWGNGRWGAGELKVVNGQDEDKQEHDLDTDMALEAGRILAVPELADTAIFTQAAAVELAGLICGTLTPDLIGLAEAWDKPVIVLQGFEAQPVDPVAWELLASLQGHVAGINAQPTDLLAGCRPEVVIPREGGEPEAAMGFQAELKVGQRVRLLSGPAVGRTGKISALENEGAFESGLHCPAVVVKLREGDRLTLPQQNVVILG